MPKRALLTAVCAFALLAAGCDDTATGPGVEPEIRNNPDSFEFQVSKLDRYSGTLTYGWSNSGVVANVNQSAALTGGTAQLTILDRNGTQVYARSLTENGTFVTAQGVTGSWQIRVVFNDATGTLNFRAQKRP